MQYRTTASGWGRCTNVGFGRAKVSRTNLLVSRVWRGEYLSMDTEMVTLVKTNGSGKFVQKAATVGVVGWNGEAIVDDKIKHEPYSFKVNPLTIRINGIKEHSLQDGKDFTQVQNEVIKNVRDKLIVTYGGAGDFKALDLESSEFEKFDLQNVFQKWTGNYTKNDEKVYQPIGLRHVYYHYYKKDIQSGVHSAVEDAKATTKLFKEVYCPLALKRDPWSMSYGREDSEFDVIQTI